MIKATSEDIKNICLKLLTEFDRLCSENNLMYSLAYGTLIGAIRHNGFIPWDDDVDVIMPRNDYEKLLAMTTTGQYQVFSYRNRDDYFYPFAKFVDTKTHYHEKLRMEKEIGIYIDIFPIDFYDDGNLNSIFKKNTFFLDKEWDYAGRSNSSRIKNIIKSARHRIFCFFNKNYLNDLLLKHDLFIQSLQVKEARKSASYTIRIYGKKEFFDYDIFENGVIEHQFESGRFKIIKSYDRFLRHIYGDYMQLPPEQDRIGHHDIDAWIS